MWLTEVGGGAGNMCVTQWEMWLLFLQPMFTLAVGFLSPKDCMFPEGRGGDLATWLAGGRLCARPV